MDDFDRNALLVAERFADGGVATAVAENTRESLQKILPTDVGAAPESPIIWALNPDTRDYGYSPSYAAILAAMNVQELIRCKTESLADIVRDIIGNPFRPVPFDPSWRTADTVGLARGIYEERAFDRLPLLADALMDAGCVDDQVLGHCRSNGPHVRGCWVVDLVLGKE